MSWRLAATHRVEYLVDGRRSISFTVDLSVGGMQLRSAAQLPLGAELLFALTLADGAPPAQVAGRVLGRTGSNARVQFIAGHPGVEAVRAHMVSRVIPDLEASMERGRPIPSKVQALAGLYEDFDRVAEAIELL
ncbi:MAG TPA: PilZ domain-containing protein, partial [Myxococcota bacterium]|nr:PilZ domain-containing protein [Myxococcota bacterium]